MPSARIFLSHSTREAVPAELRDALAAALTARGYRVLLDKDVLQLGEHWRQTINRWIGACDAAVVLLSEAALASRYVAYEVSVLSYRAELDPSFVLVPVFIDPVDEARVKASLLDPAQITERQALNRAITPQLPRDQVIERVLERLDALPDRDSPEEWRVGHLMYLLSAVPGHELERQVLELGFPLGPWLPDVSTQRKLAEALLAAELGSAQTAIRALRTYLPEPKQATVQEMLDLVASAWVDLRSLTEIPAVAIDDRGLCVNAEKHLTAKMYVLCACPRRPLDSWPVAPVDGIVGEASDEDLSLQIRLALTHELRLGGADELASELAIMQEEGDPAFVSLPARGLDEDAIRRLRAAFGGVTFFLLTGPSSPQGPLLERARLVLLRPPLEQGFEARLEDAYDRARRHVFRHFPGGLRDATD